MVASRDRFLGYIWPACRRGVTILARSEVVVWGRAKAGQRPGCQPDTRYEWHGGGEFGECL